MIDLFRLCVICGKSILWHRLYKTRNGVKPYCGERPPPSRLRGQSQRADDLAAEAEDVWSRLHDLNRPEDRGIQGSLM